MLQLKGAQWTSKGAGKALGGAGRVLEVNGRVSKAVRQASEADGGWPKAAEGMFCGVKKK